MVGIEETGYFAAPSINPVGSLEMICIAMRGNVDISIQPRVLETSHPPRAPRHARTKDKVRDFLPIGDDLSA